jgi:hypothetical protein
MFFPASIGKTEALDRTWWSSAFSPREHSGFWITRKQPQTQSSVGVGKGPPSPGGALVGIRMK